MVNRPVLAEKARELLTKLGYTTIHVRVGDGYKGWPEKAPFDVIIVTCAPEEIPNALIDQLSEGGRIIVSVGTQMFAQNLVLGVKKGGKFTHHIEK